MSPQTNSPQPVSRLRRDLGTVESYAALIGILIGAGIFKVTSDAGAITGPSVILSYIILMRAVLATSIPYAAFISTPLGREPGGEYLHISSGAADFKARNDKDYQFYRIIDVRNPSKPSEVGRWWYPGQRDGDKEPAARQRRMDIIPVQRCLGDEEDGVSWQVGIQLSRSAQQPHGLRGQSGVTSQLDRCGHAPAPGWRTRI